LRDAREQFQRVGVEGFFRNGLAPTPDARQVTGICRHSVDDMAMAGDLPPEK
jgi:hypothetical protein